MNASLNGPRRRVDSGCQQPADPDGVASDPERQWCAERGAQGWQRCGPKNAVEGMQELKRAGSVACLIRWGSCMMGVRIRWPARRRVDDQIWAIRTWSKSGQHAVYHKQGSNPGAPLTLYKAEPLTHDRAILRDPFSADNDQHHSVSASPL